MHAQEEKKRRNFYEKVRNSTTNSGALVYHDMSKTFNEIKKKHLIFKEKLYTK